MSNEKNRVAWKGLSSGDTIDIVAPASKCHPSVIDKMRDFLASWGLRAHVPTDLLGESLLYANSDEKRFNHLKNALLNSESKAIWCLLGGFGTTKIIPFLFQMENPMHPKILIGFSDITALHIFLQGQWGWPTIHGPSGYQASLNKVSADSVAKLKQILFCQLSGTINFKLVPMNSNAHKNEMISSPIIGGNLHIMETSLGTPWQIKTDNKIVLIEEINERAYRIDRALSHLAQAGVFENARAVLFADMIDKGEPDGRFLVEEVVKEFAAQCPLPVLKINNIGHGQINDPILLGTMADLYLGEQSQLVIST